MEQFLCTCAAKIAAAGRHCPATDLPGDGLQRCGTSPGAPAVLPAR
ncbi:hypothetical protein P873_12430 [Arenimonas composti TR7-09 = DSM 18010]|uniref:Uncharacterized protein n=1 Tax=Arenimonas composti TR7-09 = DSM 18010 TaxID=1121013 RepID=A0A091B8X1_9GAMM|nr:hypothetical protein P873_12430 [Arenimonas composti TR7-09 = DSM 18010]